MPTASSSGRVLLVGATGLVGSAAHTLLAPRCQVVTAEPEGCDRFLNLNVVSPGVLAESPPPVFDLFAGFEPVPAARVALAYLRSIEGGRTGQVFTVW